MNLCEAYRTGLPFRKRSQPNQAFWFTKKSILEHVLADDLEADDWEVQAKAVEVSPVDYWHYVDEIMSRMTSDGVRLSRFYFQILANRLNIPSKGEPNAETFVEPTRNASRMPDYSGPDTK